MVRIWYIRAIDNLEFRKLDEFFSRFKKLTYKKGETILRAGEEPRGVYFLKKGYVRLYSVSEDAQELTLIIYKPNDFFPLNWTFNKAGYSYFLEAMGHVEVYQVPREEFIKFVKTNGDVLFELTSRIVVRMWGLLQRMEYMVFGNAYTKVASIISICAERFGVMDKEGVVIGVILTHKDIANLLGMARETVSIEIKKLEKMGIITYQGRFIFIKDPRKLRAKSKLGLD